MSSGGRGVRFVSVRYLRTAPARVCELLSVEKELVVTRRGRPIALLTPVCEETLESTISAVRRARAVDAVKYLRLGSVKSGRNEITATEIDEEIAQARKQQSCRR